MSVAAAAPVVVAYEELADPNYDLDAALKEAFGRNGLGLVLVSGVPGLQRMRELLLPVATQLAELPPDVLQSLEDPASSYSFGWSCGREQLADGHTDTLKGSYYANPCNDNPAAGDGPLSARHPAYFRPNVWPSSQQEGGIQGGSLPQLEPAFKALGTCIVNVGLMLAHHIDKFLQGHQALSQVEVLSAARAHKARLLHYKAPPVIPGTDEINLKPCVLGQPLDHHNGWCGWHTDHSSITGLTSAMYMNQGQEVACPDPNCGLWVKNMAGVIVKIGIPPTHLAFQVGEALQVHSGGLLRATPHYVRAAKDGAGVVRNTFAVFLQPDPTCPMLAPPGTNQASVAVGQWKAPTGAPGEPVQDFGQFSALTFETYYKQDVQAPDVIARIGTLTTHEAVGAVF